MIAVSREAKEFLDTIECPAGKVLRLEEAREPSGKRRACFRIGDPEDGDELSRRGDGAPLHVARGVSQDFDGFVVTRVDTPEGVGITLSPPEAGEFSS